MADFDEAKQFAQRVFNSQFEVLIRERDDALGAAAARNAAKGTALSGGMAREAAQIYADTIHKILHARAKAFLEGVELHGVSIEEAQQPILADVTQMKEDLVRNSSRSLEELPYLRSLGMGAYLGGEMFNAGKRAVDEICAEMERKRLRAKQIPTQASQNVTNVYHVYGHNPRWNTNSTDNSVNNVTLSNQEVFATLKQELTNNVPEGEERSDILQRLDALERAQGTKTFAEKYTDFISSAANHMNIIAPFIPALAELLKKALGS